MLVGMWSIFRVLKALAAVAAMGTLPVGAGHHMAWRKGPGRAGDHIWPVVVCVCVCRLIQYTHSVQCAVYMYTHVVIASCAYLHTS